MAERTIEEIAAEIRKVEMANLKLDRERIANNQLKDSLVFELKNLFVRLGIDPASFKWESIGIKLENVSGTSVSNCSINMRG